MTRITYLEGNAVTYFEEEYHISDQGRRYYVLILEGPNGDLIVPPEVILCKTVGSDNWTRIKHVTSKRLVARITRLILKSKGKPRW